ncbi:hypothetical protein WJX73_007793 [Symbiochloris irregularis]|uniref:CW-type domain-containing protein n=1 Tax=Symbiochloris irregularis TaxID=706552 RepID=A0AAW1NK58_9CHLO
MAGRVFCTRGCRSRALGANFWEQDTGAQLLTGNLDKEDLEAEGQPQAGAGGEAAQGTDQWVQCDRCKTWRIVPDSDWGAVQEDEREEWLCEYATWDLTDHAPFSCDAGDGAEGAQEDDENEEGEGEEEGNDDIII